MIPTAPQNPAGLLDWARRLVQELAPRLLTIEQAYFRQEGIPRLAAYTVATLPSAASYLNGAVICTDETGGRTIVTSDGTNWVAESGATQSTINDDDWSGADLAIGNGGTGASTASAARAALGLAIGTDIQAWDAQLDDIAALAVTDGNFIVGDGTNWVAESGATVRTSLGLGSLAVQSTINDDDWSGADLAIGNGGTGASTASAARAALGLAIGTDIQAWDAQLDDIAALAVTDGNFIVGDGTNWVAESGATVRTSLGLGSLAVQSTINDDDWSGADLAIDNGGTGASTAAAARTALGLAIGSDVQAYSAVLAALVAGTVDGVVIGGSTPAAITGTTGQFTTSLMAGSGTISTNIDLQAVTGFLVSGAVPGSPGTNGAVVDYASSTVRIANNNGSGGAIDFYSTGPGGNRQFSISHTASAVEYPRLTGATSGNPPTLSAQGAAANLPLSLASKNNAAINVYGNGGVVVSMSPPSATPTQYVQLVGSITGGTVQVNAAGASANTPVALASKNNAAINFYGNGGVVVSMSPPSATPTQYVQLVGSITGGTVQVNAAGASANIPVALASKNNAAINFYGNGGVVVSMSPPSATPTQYVQLVGSITGGTVQVNAAGASANIPVRISNKGTAVLQLGSMSVQATVGAAGGASNVPASPTTYLVVNINGTNYAIPAFATS
jgi:hypothetical protein